MLAVERKGKIIAYMEEHQQAEVMELSSLLNVVPETIRRDLKELEQNGIITRTHGGAIYGIQDQVEWSADIRYTQNRTEKDMICERAAKLIEDGDTIFIDDSSTVSSLLKFVSPRIRFTVLTNSLLVLMSSRKYQNKNITFICTGGMYNEKNNAVYGQLSTSIMDNFLPTKAFISCAGVCAENGFTEKVFFQTELKRTVIKKSKEVIFLIDKTKIGKRASVLLGDLQIANKVISDNFPQQEIAAYMAGNPNLEIISCNTDDSVHDRPKEV